MMPRQMGSWGDLSDESSGEPVSIEASSEANDENLERRCSFDGDCERHERSMADDRFDSEKSPSS